MSSSLVITIAAIGGMAWLGFMLVSTLRNRGREEVAPNLAPGRTDDLLETRRLETTQKAAVLMSAFLAVSLPLYFLGEPERQESFVDQFDEESVARGADLVVEFACADCHGPDGVGGSAPFVEARSGVAVTWAAPALNNIFYRYEPEEINYWITYGRGNTPMPPWGVAGGGSMNEQQVEDIVNYLGTIQVPQEDVVAQIEPTISDQLNRLATAEATVQAALIAQRQVLADAEQALEQAPVIQGFSERASALLETAAEGLDTDGDGLSDAAETELTALFEEILEAFRAIEPVTLDPENPQSVGGQDDLTTAGELVDAMAELVSSEAEPVLQANVEAVEAALEGGLVDEEGGISPGALEALAGIGEQAGELGVEVPSGSLDRESAEALVLALEEAAAAEEADPAVGELAAEARSAFDGGLDPDGDGLSSAAEGAISTQVTTALEATTPTEIVPLTLDPVNPATSGEPDATVAARAVGGIETLATTLTVTADNPDPVLASAQEGVDFLDQALEEARWEIDVEGVAEVAFDGDVELAERAVGLFNGYCARCHTAGYQAGVAFTLEAGSGAFGPALWDGRPRVQFGPADEVPEEDLLHQFLIQGSQADTPYGINGFGTGRMPAWGQVLSLDDIQLLARYLRAGDLDG